VQGIRCLRSCCHCTIVLESPHLVHFRSSCVAVYLDSLVGGVDVHQQLVLAIEIQKYHPKALQQAMKRFYLFNQNKEMTNAKFSEAFQTLVSVITECGGEIGHNPVGILTALKEKGGGLETATLKELEESNATEKECYLTIAMLSTYDKSCYKKLSEDLENDYTKGSNHYPKTITEAYNLIVNDRQLKLIGPVFNDSEGITFTNVESTRPARPRAPDIAIVKCYNCNKKGHYSSDCPGKPP
jgi:hypothetical protein